jgi:hypothetical protein
MSTTSAPVALGRLSFQEARESPCRSCIASPCCTHLLLCTVDLRTILDIDSVIHMANFEGILLALGATGRTVQVYLHQSCGFLDVPTGDCTVHSTPLQPAICVQYNAHTCGYRHSFATDVDHDNPLMDPRRLAWYAEQITFDDDRRTVTFPDREEVLDAFRTMPMERRLLPPPEPDPVVEEWRSIVLSRKEPAPHELRHYGDPEVSNPCQGCGAWCCKFLVFDRGVPSDATQMEFLRYCLGFPGVEIGISAENWSVLVRTTCRHLDGNRCSVFGSPERPLRCGTFDALSCGYRSFGVTVPDNMVRVSREQFGAVADAVAFNGLGQVVGVPSVETLRDRLEQFERARSSQQ